MVTESSPPPNISLKEIIGGTKALREQNAIHLRPAGTSSEGGQGGKLQNTPPRQVSLPPTS